SGSEAGERTVDLRVTVPEATRLAVIDTDPPGLPLTIDGATVNGPAAFAVRSNASSASEWLEGSLHTISAPASARLADDNDNAIQYRFAGGTRGGAATQTTAAELPAAPLNARNA